jgi:Protein of unknown function (DUF2933)
MWNILLFIALVAICPLAMIFMMRGMHRGGPQTDMTARDTRIAQLEQEVAALRGRVVERSLPIESPTSERQAS